MRGITFGVFDLFHAGHVSMLQEAKSVCDHLTVCIQIEPAIYRQFKKSPVQSIVERQIQVSGCRYVDDVLVYESEEDVKTILDSVLWDVRILGEEYKNSDFTYREETIKKCYFNCRKHSFSSTSLRERVKGVSNG